MPTYYARYMAGDCEAVCRELNQRNDSSNAAFRSDALSVASELIDRAYRNLRLVLDQLAGLGYAFEDPSHALVEASSEDISILDSIESRMGVLPWVVRKWYERIRSVDFSQEPSQLFSDGRSPLVSVSGLGLNTPLVYQAIPKCLQLQSRLADEASSEADRERIAHFLPLGGWASNCEPKGFSLPCDSFDGVFYNEGAGDAYFIAELREAFKWGGFPFWRRMLTGRRQAYPIRHIPGYDRLLPKLTEGLEPI